MDIGKVKDFLGEDWRLFEDKFRSVLHSDVELLNSVNGRILDKESGIRRRISENEKSKSFVIT